jgi:hypothetical protein
MKWQRSARCSGYSAPDRRELMARTGLSQHYYWQVCGRDESDFTRCTGAESSGNVGYQKCSSSAGRLMSNAHTPAHQLQGSHSSPPWDLGLSEGATEAAEPTPQGQPADGPATAPPQHRSNGRWASVGEARSRYRPIDAATLEAGPPSWGTTPLSYWGLATNVGVPEKRNRSIRSLQPCVGAVSGWLPSAHV